MAKKQAYQTLLNPLGNQTQELDVSMFDKKDELDLSMFQEPSKKKEDSESTSEVQTSSSKELVGVPETPTKQDGFRTVQPHRLEAAVQYNQQVKKTREELQSMIPQIEQTIADIDKKAAINIGDNVAVYGFGKKQGDLLTARRYLQKTAKVLKSPDEEGIKAFVSGLRRNDLANLLSLGYTDAYKALKTTQIAKKVSEGEEPTEEEYLLLTGRYLLDLADSNKKRTSSYNIGNALAEMAPFLGQIYLTSPIGEAATTAATAATKKAMTKGAVDVLRKYGLTDLLKTATTAAAQSPFTGMFMQKYADNRMPQMDMDENGKIVPVQGTGETAVDAATEALGSTFSSIFSEKMGEFIKGRVSASGKGLAATLQEPGKALKSIQSLRRDLNWSGMGYEFLEEQIDGVGQALLTDDAKLNDLFDAKKQFETLATVMLAGGAMKALEIPGYFKEKGYKKDLEKATEVFEKTVDEPSRKSIEAAINTDNVEEMQKRLSSEDFSHLTPEQGKTVLDYMKAKISYNSLFEAANTKLETTEKKATVPQNNVTVTEKTPETIQSTTQEEIPVYERYYQESMAKKQPDVVEKMPVFKNKKFSIATILPNGDISNVYVRNEGDSHKTYMSPEDAQAYEDGRMTIGFWSPTSNTFMEAPQKGKEFGQRVMDIAASKVTPSGIKPQETTGNIPEQVRATERDFINRFIKKEESLGYKYNLDESVANDLLNRSSQGTGYFSNRLKEITDKYFVFPISGESGGYFDFRNKAEYGYLPKPTKDIGIRIRFRDFDTEKKHGEPRLYDKRIVNERGDIIDNRYVPYTTEYETSRENDPNHLFRGMSGWEFNNVIRNKGIESDKNMNFENQQETTSFAQYQQQAFSYAYGFSAWHDIPDFDNPRYVVKVKRSGVDYDINGVGEADVKGKVPLQNITDVWEIRLIEAEPGRFEVRETPNGEFVQGSRSPAITKSAVRKLSDAEVNKIKQGSQNIIESPKTGEPRNAERIGTETETIRGQEEMVEEEKERLRVRDNAENGMEAPEGATEQVEESRNEVKPEKGIIFKDKNYQDEVQIKESLAAGEITAPEYNQAVGMLNKRNFEDSKERLRQNLEGLFTKQAIGDEATKLTDVYDSLVDFIKNAIAVYGDRIKSGRDVAKLTGIKYNNLVKDAYLEASGKKVIDSGKKMRGFPKRIKEFEAFQDIKVDIEANPELRYDPQVLKDIKEKLPDMTDAELIKASNPEFLQNITEGNDNMAVLAYQERINRAKAKGEDIMPIIEELSRKGTMWGQLIRQFAEFKGSTAEGMVSTFEKMLEKQQRFLTPEQKTKLTKLSESDIDARKAMSDQAEKARILPTEENVKEYKRLRDEAEKSYVAMAQYMQDLTPKGFWDTMGMVLQGNLLTPMSQITNVFANLMNIPITGGANALSSSVDALHSAITGSERTTTMNPKVALYGLRGFLAGTKEAARQIRTGVPVNEKMEIARGFRPIRSFQQAFSGEDIPVNKRGEVELKDRANKFIQGTLGFPAEVMFRLLNLGDKPFYRMGEAMTLYRIGKGKGLKGKDLENFVMFPTKQAQETATRAAQEITFQEESGTSKAALGIARAMQNFFPDSGFWRFIMRTQMPYIKTPANIISQTVDIAAPAVAFAKSAYYASKGNKREALIHLGKGGIGLMIGMAAKELIANGLMSPSADDEKKIKNLQYETMPPNSVNITGIKRLINGEDPSYKPGDEVVNYTKMGLVGMALGVRANVTQTKKDIQRKDIDEKLGDYAANTIAAMIEVPSYALEQSFLQGTTNLISAISDRQWDYWLTNTFKAVSSVALPNTLDAINRATRQYIPEMKGDNLEERLANVIRNKLFMTDDLPLTRNLWGEPLLQTPDGSNNWLYQMFNVTKLQDLQEKPESKIIYGLYRKTENADVVPSVPTRKITVNNSAYELNSEQYERYLELVGKTRKEEFKKLINMQSFKNGTDDSKIKQMEYTWGKGRDKAKSQFLKEYPITQLRKIKK